ncbi:hypothetical protein Y1Q_0001531 [Alligator mississippiensis]|uniref:Uncharacterized protein n=1 Tax=Alligator mississippiensis TaxID=8496 RepID=A0A151M9X8_ALLMI|nr:hypothetical protein Y1Q_0001531 [Alligator mississippiensis]
MALIGNTVALDVAFAEGAMDTEDMDPELNDSSMGSDMAVLLEEVINSSGAGLEAECLSMSGVMLFEDTVDADLVGECSTPGVADVLVCSIFEGRDSEDVLVSEESVPLDVIIEMFMVLDLCVLANDNIEPIVKTPDVKFCVDGGVADTTPEKVVFASDAELFENIVDTLVYDPDVEELNSPATTDVVVFKVLGASAEVDTMIGVPLV